MELVGRAEFWREICMHEARGVPAMMRLDRGWVQGGAPKGP